MIHLTTNAHLLKVTCDLLIVSHILTVKSYDPILSSTFELLYSICHAFSLKSLLFFDFTAYNFLIILFLKLGEIWGMTPLPKCKNSCVLGLPKQKGTRRRADKEIQKGKKSPKDKGRARSVCFFLIGSLYFWPNPVSLTIMQRSRGESGGKKKSLDIVLEVKNVKWIFSQNTDCFISWVFIWLSSPQLQYELLSYL